MLGLVAITAALCTYASRGFRAMRVVGPPDLIDVQVRTALPNRPIAGTRLIRPDGMMTLGYYGEVKVAGLTPNEVKAAVAVHLRRDLSDQALGLVRYPDGAVGRRSAPRRVSPFDTDQVSIRLVKRNTRRPNLFDRVVLKLGLSDALDRL